MILKIQGKLEHEWVLIDNISDFIMREKELEDEVLLKVCDYDLTHPNWPKPTEGTGYKVAKFARKVDSKNILDSNNYLITIIFDGIGYLCNDNGQTIEKL